MNRYRVSMVEGVLIEFDADGFDVENGYVIFYRKIGNRRQEIHAYYHPLTVKMIVDGNEGGDHVAG